MAFRTYRTRIAYPKWLLATALSLGLTSATGCGTFFINSTSTDSGSGSSGSTSTDFAFFGNSSKGEQYLNGYGVTTTGLTATTNSPYSLGSIIPQSMAITPKNTFLYIASDPAIGNGAIYGYSLTSTGVPSILNSGSYLALENAEAIAISPDGLYLFSLNSISSTIEEFSINTSTGILTSVGNYPLSQAADGGTLVPSGLTFAPSGDFLVAALGTGGADSFTYSTSTGALSQAAVSVINPGNSLIGIYAVAIDANNYVYTAGTNTTASPGLQVFSGSTVGVLNGVSSINTGTNGNAAHSVVVNSANTFVYTGNYSDGTISAYAIASGGKLSAVSGSPFTAPVNVAALARDSSGGFLVAAGYNGSTGYQLFSIGSTGALTSLATAASGTSTAVPSTIAASH